jgi:formylglycine-generating enzyme required for sulfatase activity
VNSSIVSRADFLRAIAAAGEAGINPVAELLGYAPAEAAKRDPPAETVSRGGPAKSAPAPRVGVQSAPPKPVVFWRPTRFEERPVRREPAPAADITWHNRPRQPPPFQPLASLRELEPRLRRTLRIPAPAGDVDIDRVVAGFSQGRHPDPLPREDRNLWPEELHLILDRSDRLIPYWDDQTLLKALLPAIMPHTRMQVARVDEVTTEPLIAGRTGAWTPPSSGGAVLVLGDLGCLDRDPDRFIGRWRDLALRCAAAGAHPAALLPGPLSRCDPALARLWNARPWETGAPDLPQDQPNRTARADGLFGMLAGCVRIEPGLLRAVRRSLPAGLADAGTEADVWQHTAIASDHSAAATVRQDGAEALAALLANAGAATQQRVLAARHGWRHALPDEIWFLEVVGLPASVRNNLPHPADFNQAEAFFQALRPQRPGTGHSRQAVDAWLEEARNRVGGEAWTVPAFATAAAEAAHRCDSPARLPGAVDPAWLAAGAERMLHVWQCDKSLVVSDSSGQRPARGSLLGMLSSTNGFWTAEAMRFWAGAEPPAWATAWGADRYGPWVAFTIRPARGEPVSQRMRWCPPGSFMMGSPPDEPGRWDAEGPRHRATLREGFWLFDTPCTQALWRAVTGNNPSRFKSPDRPVETVSFDDVGSFLARINERVEGLNLSLPSETQWEYACRAGTDTATYAGPIELIGANNAPVLDAIAWYGGNSGVDYDLAKGADSEGWDEKQYPHTRAGTRRVGWKQPNAFGLHDMLGNVYEWVADAWLGSYDGAPADGSARPGDGAADRVLRGGSWIFGARGVRSAYRRHFDPARRNDYLGFRCARVQNGDQRPAERSGAFDPGESAESAERGRPQGSQGAAQRSELLRAGDAHPLPDARLHTVLIRTDSQELRLTAARKTDDDLLWASVVGRDCHGLFADFTPGDPAVRQRMRWIPPGAFLMGSPDDEPGRFNTEGPRQPVRIGEGFWLFDTPCTQALWEAVMGENPSRFKHLERPVESVGFDQVEAFLSAINERKPGLNLSLPSEARWEYACRAGTDTATYAGPVEILGQRNAPVLDDIAWYGGNSGAGYDLDAGYESAGWPEKQFPHTKAGTRVVKGKRPNLFGLYDMLGNVWEWCDDVWHSSHDGAAPDGAARPRRDASPDSAADRVIRGGSWSDSYARYVRAAYRRGRGPAFRDDYLGFRCARVQTSGQRQVERSGAFGPGEPAESAERGRPPGPQGGAKRARQPDPGEGTGDLGSPVSDREARRRR